MRASLLLACGLAVLLACSLGNAGAEPAAAMVDESTSLDLDVRRPVASTGLTAKYVQDQDQELVQEETEETEDEVVARRNAKGGYSWYAYAYAYGGWYSFYDWYGGFYSGFYSAYDSWYSWGYNFYDWYFGYYSFYNGFYDWYDWYSFYDWYSWYDAYGGFYSWYDWYDWYSWYSWYSGYYGSSKFGAVTAYKYYYSNAETFHMGYAGYYYYYWYHYVGSTDHWNAKLQLGWSNWADILQGAYIAQASSFIETWKCNEKNALTNVLAMPEYRKDTCENGDRRWIFANGDTFQRIIVDLRKSRQISEIGVEFGDATERLPSMIKVSYMAATKDKVDPADFTLFGEMTHDINEYVKALKASSVTAQYIMWEFEPNAKDGIGSAFLQLVAAGPAYDENPSSGYVVLVVLIMIGLLVVGALVYFLSKNKALRRRFYRPTTKKDIARENAEFSSDDGSDSSSNSDSDDDSSTDSEGSKDLV